MVTISAPALPSWVVITIEVEKPKKKPLVPTIATVELQAVSTKEIRTIAKRRGIAARTMETPWPGASCLRKT
jgi:hypothetical protein